MIQFLISWGPMLLLIAVWIYAMKRGGTFSYKTHVADMKHLAEVQVEEMRKTNETLARIEELLRQETPSRGVE